MKDLGITKKLHRKRLSFELQKMQNTNVDPIRSSNRSKRLIAVNIDPENNMR
jgi:hypothetical protein